MTEEKQKTCDDCKWAVFHDEGYSNYTVENTVFECAKKAHPNDGFDRFYGEDARLKFAAECPEFTAGDSVQIDCDQECFDDGSLTPEQIEIAAMLDYKPYRT